MRRDALGFATGQPTISQEQLSWLIARMSAATDREATMAAKANYRHVRAWKNDPAFCHMYRVALGDSREAFRVLGAQLLPQTLKTIQGLYERAILDGNLRAAQIAMTMHLRSQGLLIDRVSSDESSKVEELLGLLRQTRSVQVLDMEPRP